MDIINDPIVKEVRDARNAHACFFNKNMDEIVSDIKKRQQQYGSRLVRRNPKVKLKDTGS